MIVIIIVIIIWMKSGFVSFVNLKRLVEVFV